MTNLDLPQDDDQASIHVFQGEVVAVGKGFTALTGFSCGDVVGCSISEVLTCLLKLSPSVFERLTSRGTADGYIFTPSLEAREVTIDFIPAGAESVAYTLYEKPGSRISSTLSVLGAIFQEEFMCVALYSVPELMILKANNAYLDFAGSLGYGDCAVGNSIREHAGFRLQMEELLDRLVSTPRVTYIEEKKLTAADGMETWRNYTFQPVFSGNALKYILEVSKDVSDRVRARAVQEKQAAEIRQQKEKLEEQNRLLGRLARLLDFSDEAIFVWELSGPIIYWNKGAERMYGYESCDAVGRVNAELLKTVFPEDYSQAPLQYLESVGELNCILQHMTKDGRQIYVESRMQLIQDENEGKFVLETNRDITARKLMEDELRESELNFRLASEGSGAGVYTYDFAKNKGYWSAEYKMILGLPPDAVLSIDPEFSFLRVHPEDNDALMSAMLRANDPAVRAPLDMEYRIVRPDRTIRWVHVRGQTFFAGEEKNALPYLAAGSIMDVTEEKLMRDQIIRISEELMLIIESTDDYIWAVDLDGRIKFSNLAARNHFIDFFGKDIAEGESVIDLVPPQIIKSIQGEIQDKYLDHSIQFDLRTPNGGRVISYSVNPVIINGELLEVTVFGKDITERLNTEREMIRLNASLEERVTERTALLEQSVSDLKNIALVLSHDLKSALRGLAMCANDILDNDAVTENAYKIKRIGSEIQSMVEGLMKFERSSRMTLTKEEVSMKKTIISVFNELNSTAAAQQGLLEFETGLPPVQADKELIKHAVMNILSNALKFTKPGNVPKIVVGCRAEDNAYVFYFKDNGIGFDMAYSEKIFGVFERLHSRNDYEGSGVGLAIVRNIVQRHGGRVWVESEEGIGTTFYFTLPVQAEGDDHV